MSKLLRTINSRTAIALVVGTVIGSGVFMKPSLMLGQLGSPWLLLSVWVVAGLVTIFGALSNAEVASLYPETGGPFIFFQKMYGKTFAFLYGWAAFAVINTAGNASIAYICAEYTNYFIALPRFDAITEKAIRFYIPFIGYVFPLANAGVKALTIILILILTAVNYRTVHGGGALQRFLTALKALAILLLIGGIFTSGKGSFTHLSQLVDRNFEMSYIGAYMAALSGAFWAYDGWNNINTVAGEIKDPQRNIPKSLLLGLGACMVIYLLLNLAYIYVLPAEQMKQSSFVASDTAEMVWGAIGGSLITLMVIFSTFGALNANIFATARLTFSLGEESKWFSRAAKVQPDYKTPGNALWLNAIWASAMVISGSFDMLTDMLIFVSWFFYGMGGLGLFILRWKKPDLPRVYKVPGYPIIPAIFVLFTALYLVTTLYTDIANYRAGNVPIINSLLGVLITLVGLPVYWLSRR